MIIKRVRIDNFTRGFLTAALFNETDNSDPSGGDPLDSNYDLYDFSMKSLKKAVQICNKFKEDNADLLAKADYSDLSTRFPEYTEDDCAGHDLWFSSNGHGVGFFDRGFTETTGDALQEAARAIGGFDVVIGDNGLLYLE